MSVYVGSPIVPPPPPREAGSIDWGLAPGPGGSPHSGCGREVEAELVLKRELACGRGLSRWVELRLVLPVTRGDMRCVALCPLPQIGVVALSLFFKEGGGVGWGGRGKKSLAGVIGLSQRTHAHHTQTLSLPPSSSSSHSCPPRLLLTCHRHDCGALRQTHKAARQCC